MSMPRFPLRPDACPFCGKAFDFATCVANGDVPNGDAPREPVPGDFTLCSGCGEWLVFDAERRLRQPTETEYLEVVKPEFQLLRSAWTEWRSSEQARQQGCEADQQ